MDRDLLSHFPVVLMVAQRGGFASAAAALNMGSGSFLVEVELTRSQ
jgi:hypothetical protein